MAGKMFQELLCLLMTLFGAVNAHFNIDTKFATTSVSNITFRVKTQKYKKLKNTMFNSYKINWTYLAPEAVHLPLVECGKLCQETTDCCGFFYVNGNNSILNEPPPVNNPTMNHTSSPYPNCYLNDMALPRSKTAVSPNVDYYEIKSQCTMTSTNPCAKGDCIPNFEKDSFTCDCSTVHMVNFNDTVCARKSIFQPLNMHQFNSESRDCLSLLNTTESLFFFWMPTATANHHTSVLAGLTFDTSNDVPKYSTILKATLKFVLKKAVDSQSLNINAVSEGYAHSTDAACRFIGEQSMSSIINQPSGFIDDEESLEIDFTDMLKTMYQSIGWEYAPGNYLHLWISGSLSSSVEIGFEIYGYEDAKKQPTLEILWEEP